MENESKKLKTILRNQINEIKELKKQLLDNGKGGVDKKTVEELKKYKKLLDDQQKKFKNVLETKDSMIQATKKDLKSAQREIEEHLRRHSDNLLNLHQQLINERSSRDFLLSNMTNELVNALSSGSNTGSAKPKEPKKEIIIDKVDTVFDTIKLPGLFPESDKKLTILYAAPTAPNFDESSGGKRAYLMLKILAEKYNVICYTRRIYSQTHKDVLESLGIKVLSKMDPIHLIEKLPDIDVIIAAWYYSYYEISPIINHFKKARVIIDSVDVHWVREERSLGKWEGITIDSIETNKELEIQAYESADVVWVVSEEDLNAVKKEIPKADVRVVSNIHIMKPDSFVKKKENKILFFGGYNHYPNINAVRILATQIFPKIKKLVKDAELIIAGSKAPDEVRELGEIEGVEFRGFINFADVADLYKECKLTIVPLTEGAGIKGKICEAIEHRLPVVTNDIGNEGILLENKKDGFVSNNIDDMAQYAMEILGNSYNLEKITERAQEKVEQLLGIETNRAAMEDSFIPAVDICIVTYNKLELLKNCVNSIFEHTQYPKYNILIHSNACTDGTKEYIEELENKHENVHAFYSETNDVFVLPNNSMMRYNRNHDVVLLNNDVLVTDNWLTGLVEEAYKSRRIGIVGSKILYPDNTLQEFGSELYTTGSGMNIGKHGDPNDPHFLKPLKASYVSGCSMYIKRKTINEIGVFDELFHPCYAEDSDYCYTAWENDIEVNVTPASVIYHIEGASSGTDTSKGFKKFQKINIQKFLAKHASTVDRINEKVKSVNSELSLF